VPRRKFIKLFASISSSPCISLAVVALFIKRGESLFRGFASMGASKKNDLFDGASIHGEQTVNQQK
jgi:hypothetical protein